MLRRTFLKAAVSAAIGASLVKIPLVDPVPVAAKAAAIDVDLKLADIVMRRALADFWRGTVVGDNHMKRAVFEAYALRDHIVKGSPYAQYPRRPERGGRYRLSPKSS